MEFSEALLTGVDVTLSEALSTGGLVTGVGIGIVFSVLIILMGVLYLFKLIFGRQPKAEKTPKPAKQKTAKPTAVKDDELVAVIAAAAAASETEDEELIAVLTAAVAASLNTSTYNLRIKSYRRIRDDRPSWNREGLRENIESRF